MLEITTVIPKYNQYYISNNVDLLTRERKAKYFKVDVFGKNDWNLLYNLEELVKLDLIHLDNVFISKNIESDYQLQEISSGEYNILFSMLAMFSRIENDSIILIDEPEISLHPNWQMTYINQLKQVFKDFHSCHFVIASHSHFIVSDLEGESSSVTALKPLESPEKNKRIQADLIKTNTYGWSAEDILYNIFNVKSTSNPYLEADLTELLGMISNNIQDVAKIEGIIKKIDQLPKRPNDPLQEILSDARIFLTEIKNA